MFRSIIKLVTGASLAVVALTGAVAAQTVVIGQFGNPTPMQVAVADQKFEAATGWDIEWRKFSSGTDVIAAMAAGDIDVAELGSSPLAIAASQGVELQLFMLAQVIGEAESLIVRDGSGIENLADIKGKRIAVPVGSTAHFSLMGAIQQAGLSESDVTIINMPPDQIAAAWQQGAIDGAFIWQPVQSEILKTGTLLVGGDQTAEWGFPTFDGWVAGTGFAADNMDSLVKFAKVMDEANRAYLDNVDAWTADSAEVGAIAGQTGADASQIPNILKGFAFIPLSDQVSDTWLGSADKTMKATADFLKAAGRIDTTVDDYGVFVNTDVANAAIQ
jgi:taurine transport system substrate-binding protein